MVVNAVDCETMLESIDMASVDSWSRCGESAKASDWLDGGNKVVVDCDVSEFFPSLYQ